MKDQMVQNSRIQIGSHSRITITFNDHTRIQDMKINQIQQASRSYSRSYITFNKNVPDIHIQLIENQSSSTNISISFEVTHHQFNKLWKATCCVIHFQGYRLHSKTTFTIDKWKLSMTCNYHLKGSFATQNKTYINITTIIIYVKSMG